MSQLRAAWASGIMPIAYWGKTGSSWRIQREERTSARREVGFRFDFIQVFCYMPTPNSEESLDANIQPGTDSHNIPPIETGVDLMIKRLEQIEDQVSSLKADLVRTRTGATRSAQTSPGADASVQPREGAAVSVPAKSSGRHFVEDATGATIYLGSHSDIPATLGLRQPNSDAGIGETLLFDQLVPRTYPFANLWGAQAGAGEICQSLPEDSDIIRYDLYGYLSNRELVNLQTVIGKRIKHARTPSTRFSSLPTNSLLRCLSSLTDVLQ